MQEVLANAIAVVIQEREGHFHSSFAAASCLVAEYGEEELAERVVTEVPSSVPWEVVADLLGILEWSTRDNGAAIHRQAESWLIEGDNLRKIQIALNLDAYPFIEADQMASVLRRVSERHPEVATHCARLVEQRASEGSAS